MRTIETKVYAYSELSEKAQKVAKNWLCEDVLGNDDDCWNDPAIDTFKQVSAALGIELFDDEKTGRESVHYRLNFMSDDGAFFTGDYSYKAGSVGAIQKFNDGELTRIAKDLYSLQCQFGRELTAEIRVVDVGTIITMGDDEYENLIMKVKGQSTFGKSVTVHSGRSYGNVESALKVLMGDLANWLFEQIREANHYYYSEENTVILMELNGYEFLADGRVFWEGSQ